MNKETKKIYLAWSEKGSCDINSLNIYMELFEIDQALQNCNEILGEVNLQTGYKTKASDIEKVMEGKATLQKYINALPYYVDSELDQPLWKDFNHNATDTISRIMMENFTVDNTVGLTEDFYTEGTMSTWKKSQLGFSDFLGTSDGEVEGNGSYMLSTNGSVEGFSNIFAGQYETMKASGLLGENSEMTQQEFLEQFYKQGEFNHDKKQPFLDFVSSVLDITIIKPLIEACIGKDLITKEDLTDLECGLKVVFAIVDVVTLGGALPATKLSEVGTKQGLKTFGKIVAIDFASNTVASGVGAIGQELDLPVPITIMLSLVAGVTVSVSGTKMLFKNANGIVIGEALLDGEISVQHAVGSANQAQSVLNGIDPQYFNSKSRFGGGFYVGADSDTLVAELAEHGNTASFTIGYDMNLGGQKVLDLTNSKVASEWDYVHKLTSTEACQEIGILAKNQGYSVIKFKSYRGEGMNYVIYNNFNDILVPRIVTPVE